MTPPLKEEGDNDKESNKFFANKYKKEKFTLP